VRIFLLLPTTPTRAISGRSRPMRAGFPTGTHRCRSSEEVHSLLGRRVCVYRERRTFSQKLWLSFETHFRFCLLYTLIHGTYSVITLTWISYLVLYAYVCVFAYSRFIENPPIWSWEINPSFLRWFYHTQCPVKIRKIYFLFPSGFSLNSNFRNLYLNIQSSKNYEISSVGFIFLYLSNKIM
jgi:hypothetical protein